MAKRKSKSEEFIDLLTAELPVDDDYMKPEAHSGRKIIIPGNFR